MEQHDDDSASSRRQPLMEEEHGESSTPNALSATPQVMNDPLLQWNPSIFDYSVSSNISFWNRLRSTYVRSGLIYMFVFAIMAGGMVYGVSVKLFDEASSIDWDVNYNVGFLGNSYFFVNDIPRCLEAISEGHVYQNSVIHPGSSLSELWVTGNGMGKLWKTDKAYMGHYDTYDYGLCSVAHILQGYDEYMDYGNSAGKYYDDGLNPCINDYDYSSFINNDISVASWDYIVLVDQTKRMAIPSARNESVQVLMHGYAKFLQHSQAPRVVLVDTHAFWSENTNMTGLSDIVTFTRLIYQGVQTYVTALSSVLRRPPLVAPIGLAFLVIYEEDTDIWKSLFLDDQIHMSMTGSYLFAMVLYTTIFGHLPSPDIYLPALFSDSRQIVGNVDYPDSSLEEYFRSVTRKVVLKRYIPNSLYHR